MGIEYTLANHKNKTVFELGKGSWYALTETNRKGDACLLYEDEIYDVIINEIWDYQVSGDSNFDDPAEWRQYAKEVAAKIHQFVGDADPSDIYLCNDSDDSNSDLRRQGYRWVGSRYSSFDEVHANPHLK